MSRLKIAIACQGGGSQTAFTAGALKTLCEARIDEEFDVVGISGTSGGAVCATLALVRLHEGRAAGLDPPDGVLEGQYAQGWSRTLSTGLSSTRSRMVNTGLLPTFQLSPSSPVMQSMTQFMTAGQREGFSDFRGCSKTTSTLPRSRPGGRARDGPC